MKELYYKFIKKIPQDKKISDNVFKARITMSVIAILSCLTVMLSTAFAFFNSNLTKNFTMRAAVWDVVVEEVSNGKVRSVYTCLGEDTEIHEFILYRSGTATATEGYCEIKITNPEGETERYFTNSFKDEKTIKIRAIDGCKIEFIPRWGNPSDYGITVLYSGNIDHSHTEVQLTEESAESGADGETGESSTETESGGSQQESSADTSSETSTNETESSSGEKETSGSDTESTGSSESSEKTTSDSSAESSSSSSKESSSSSESSKNSESGSSSETTSAPSKSTGDSSTSSSDSSSSSNNKSSSDGGSSSSSSSSSSDGGSSSSSSSSSSGGGESSSSAAAASSESAE